MYDALVPDGHRFIGFGTTLTIWADRLEIERVCWRRWPPWKPVRTVIPRSQVIGCELLDWGPALLLVTAEGASYTLPLGSASATALLVLRGSYLQASVPRPLGPRGCTRLWARLRQRRSTCGTSDRVARSVGLDHGADVCGDCDRPEAAATLSNTASEMLP